MFHVPERYRLLTGPMASDERSGNNGAFRIPVGTRYATVIASDGSALDKPRWEHVSVSFKDRCPTWDEMTAVAAHFWDAEDTLIQYRPPESEYVNNMPYCLHWWRPADREIPRPPAILVGIKARGVLRSVKHRAGRHDPTR